MSKNILFSLNFIFALLLSSCSKNEDIKINEIIKEEIKKPVLEKKYYLKEYIENNHPDFLENFANENGNIYTKNGNPGFDQFPYKKKYESNEIIEDFFENEIGANLKYGDPFEFFGKIKKFNSDFRDHPSIEFWGSKNGRFLYAKFGKDQISSISKLKRNENISIFCSSASDFGPIIVLENCVTKEKSYEIRKNITLENSKKFINGERFDVFLSQGLFFQHKRLPFKLCRNFSKEICSIYEIDSNIERNEVKGDNEYHGVLLAKLFLYSEMVRNLYGLFSNEKNEDIFITDYDLKRVMEFKYENNEIEIFIKKTIKEAYEINKDTVLKKENGFYK